MIKTGRLFKLPLRTSEANYNLYDADGKNLYIKCNGYDKELCYVINNYDCLVEDNILLTKALQDSQTVMRTFNNIMANHSYSNSEKLKAITLLLDVHVDEIYENNQKLLEKSNEKINVLNKC